MHTAPGVCTYGYTADRLTSVTDPFGQTRSQTYNADGQVETVIVNGQVVATYTGTDGNLTQRTDALGWPTQFEYTNGQLTLQRDPEQREQRYEYDAQGRLWKTLDGNTNAIVREYGPVSMTGSGSSCPSCSGGSGSSNTQRLLNIRHYRE